MRKRVLSFVVAALACGAISVRADAPSTEQLHQALTKLITSNLDAADQCAHFKADADQRLKDEPYPVETIVSEGKLGNDPQRVRTYKSLPDLDKLNTFDVAYLLTADTKYLERIRVFLLAWAKVNISQGDPIDDSKLEPAILGYQLTREKIGGDDQTVIDKWMRQIADKTIEMQNKRDDVRKNNWQSHRLKVIGMIGFALQDKKLIDYAVNGYKEQVQDNLLPSGSSFDFVERDALHYHTYDLEPLLQLAITADQNGVDLFHYQSPSGASLPKSVEFLIPYATGQKTHAEFVNSKVKFDKDRGDAGDREYQAGHPWSPRAGGRTLELAEYFDVRLTRLVARLRGDDSNPYPSFQTVLNAAMHVARQTNKPRN